MFGKSSGIGERITVDGRNYRIVGVVKDVSTLRFIPFAEIWVPLTTAKTDAYRNDGVFGNFTGIVLAKSRADIPRIQKEYSARVSRLDYPIPPDFSKAEGTLLTGFDFMTRQVARRGPSKDPGSAGVTPFLVGVMLLFMILPTLNLINLNLSRILERSSEIGVRKAFGASSRVLAGQFLVENLVVTLLGGCIGLVLSLIVLHAANLLQIIPYATFQVNGRVYLYGLLVTLVFGVLSGVYPAWKMSRYHPVEALRKSPM
jgi:putative ABC transport system permease protein